jgi:L-erythro-3,5-diaminohexanoate dehydrogenase
VTVQADVTTPLDVAGEMAAPADLTLVCTSVPGAEGAALVATATRGTIVFFSTATQFSAAALGADAVGSQARLVIPNGLTDDRGDFALALLREVEPLRLAFGGYA